MTMMIYGNVMQEIKVVLFKIGEHLEGLGYIAEDCEFTYPKLPFPVTYKFSDGYQVGRCIDIQMVKDECIATIKFDKEIISFGAQCHKYIHNGKVSEVKGISILETSLVG